MKNFIVVLFISGIAVLSISAKVFDKWHVSKDMLQFIESKNYTYSSWKKDIPKDVMKGINEFENGRFNPGDIGDEGKIGMGDMRNSNAQFEGRLNFVMANDSFCLLAYGHGVFTIHNTVYFIKYKPALTLVKFKGLGDWTDTSSASVVKALQQNPMPDTIWNKSDTTSTLK
jgi:hypothetical protein